MAICEEFPENWEINLIAETVQGNMGEENNSESDGVITLDKFLKTIIWQGNIRFNH